MARIKSYLRLLWSHNMYKVRVIKSRVNYFINNWLLTTNHKRIAVLYFYFIIITSFSGLILATIIRIELAYPGRSILDNNAEKYLTIISLHGIVMVFFVVIPALFGAFGNFLLPTQLGVRDVAFPRLNSFMFWVTPSGFILLLHIYFFDSGVNNLLINTKDVVDYKIVGGKSRLYLNLNKETCYHNKYFSRLDSLSNNYIFWYLYRIYWLLYDLFIYLNNLVNQVLIFFYKKYVFIRSVNNYSILVDYRRAIDKVFLESGFIFFSKIKKKETFKVINIKVSSIVSNQLIPGWAFITPFSSRVNFSETGKVDIALVVVFSAGLGSVFSAFNYVITYRCLGSIKSKNRREVRSFFADGLLVGSRMMLAANPALLIAILLLLSDRHLNTSVFDFSGGGDTILFQHLFWFFGHPEVYIIIIPCFGFVNSLLPFYLRKRLSGRLSLQFSMYTIAFMGFSVWGHHMYMVGLSNTARTLYSTMTVMISVPASTKVLHWCVTLLNSSPILDVGLLFLISFNYFFTLGGLSGMFVAHIGFDILFHDTFYVIGHFHVMLAGAAVSCIFAAFYFYFFSIFGVSFSVVFGYLHFFFYFFGQLFTVIPMFWLGYSGMPRRIMDYPSHFGGWHSIISAGHVMSLIGYCFFICMILDSFWDKKSVKSKTLGIPRLNNRFIFYTYCILKLNNQDIKKKINLVKTSNSLVNICNIKEATNIGFKLY